MQVLLCNKKSIATIIDVPVYWFNWFYCKPLVLYVNWTDAL